MFISRCSKSYVGEMTHPQISRPTPDPQPCSFASGPFSPPKHGLTPSLTATYSPRIQHIRTTFGHGKFPHWARLESSITDLAPLTRIQDAVRDQSIEGVNLNGRRMRTWHVGQHHQPELIKDVPCTIHTQLEEESQWYFREHHRHSIGVSKECRHPTSGSNPVQKCS